MTVAADVDAKDLGLPHLSGFSPPQGQRRGFACRESRPLGRWFRLQTAVLKMESDDSPDKVADFYKKALAKYGKVLDCSHAAAADADPNERHSPKPIT